MNRLTDDRNSRVAADRVASICNQLGGLCADSNGFVPVRSLLERFQATLIIRPLLVEAMIAKTNVGEELGAHWTVLVDSERYSVSHADVAQECFGKPLPARFRFTVAHELAHSISFRPTEFGLQPIYYKEARASRETLVRAIEAETDRASPLLLLPDATLQMLLARRASTLDMADLQSVCRNFGLSRYALIHRLRWLLHHSAQNSLREAKSLVDLGIGLGEWGSDGVARLRKWPLFVNFRNRIEPSLINKLVDHDFLPIAAEIDASDFALCGGENWSTEFSCAAGLRGTRLDEKITVRFSAEPTEKLPGSRFLFAVSRKH
jgi:hypothetical protein